MLGKNLSLGNIHEKAHDNEESHNQGEGIALVELPGLRSNH